MVGRIFLDNVLIREGITNLGLNFKANLCIHFHKYLKGNPFSHEQHQVLQKLVLNLISSASC